MLSFLKNHPFPVEAFFKRSLVITFAIPKEQIQGLIPGCLQLDTFNDHYAFIAIAMVQTKDLRPKGFPKLLGNDFFLVGYRVFVRYTNNAGKNLRGLYILKSETDKRKMQFFGNLLTHYNYTTTDIQELEQNGIVRISSATSNFSLEYKNPIKDNIPLPKDSPFADWKEARRFSGPLPFTFTYNARAKEVLIIEGVRENWKPNPVKIIKYNFSFLDDLKLDNVRLANAFIINDIPYYWKKGKIEKWKKKEEDSRAS